MCYWFNKLIVKQFADNPASPKLLFSKCPDLPPTVLTQYPTGHITFQRNSEGSFDGSSKVLVVCKFQLLQWQKISFIPLFIFQKQFMQLLQINLKRINEIRFSRQLQLFFITPHRNFFKLKPHIKYWLGYFQNYPSLAAINGLIDPLGSYQQVAFCPILKDNTHVSRRKISKKQERLNEIILISILNIYSQVLQRIKNVSQKYIKFLQQNFGRQLAIQYIYQKPIKFLWLLPLGSQQFSLYHFILFFMSNLKLVSRYSKTEQTSVPRTSMQTSIGHFNTTQTVVKQCRICLVSEAENQDQNYIRPCKCSGSVKYVHEACMKTWIKSSLQTKNRQQQEKIISQGIQCEMCKYLIKFQLAIVYGCNNVEELSKLISQKKLLFFILVLLMIVSCVGFGFSLFTIVSTQDLTDNRNGLSFQIILAICGVALLFLFIMLGVYTYVGEFMIKKSLDFRSIKSYSAIEIYSRNSHQIIPMDDDTTSQIPEAQMNS